MIPCTLGFRETRSIEIVRSVEGTVASLNPIYNSERFYLQVGLLTGATFYVEVHPGVLNQNASLFRDGAIDAFIVGYRENSESIQGDMVLPWWESSLDIQLPTGLVISGSISPELYKFFGLADMFDPPSESRVSRFETILGDCLLPNALGYD